MMVTGPKVDGATPTISPGIRKTIQSIKEIVGNHSDADIYVALKETNMDPNETAQKLLNQDPFHEVKRKRSKKKENVGYKGPMESSKKQQELVDQGSNFESFDQNDQIDDNYKMDEKSQRDDSYKMGENSRRDDNYKMGEKSQRGGYNHRGGYNQRDSSVVRRFGSIRRGDDEQRGDIAHKFDDSHKNDDFKRGDRKHDVNQRVGDVLKEDGNLRGVDFHRGGSFQRGRGFQRGSGVRRGVTFQREGFARNPLPVINKEFRVVRDNRFNQNTSQDTFDIQQGAASKGEEGISNVSAKGYSSETVNSQKAMAARGSSEGKVIASNVSDDRRTPYQSSSIHRQAGKSKDPRPRSAGQASNNSVLGVYSSSSDPVHVPSPATSSTNGSFRREVGVVGVRKMPTDNSGKQTPANAALVKSYPSAESSHSHNLSPKSNQSGRNTATVSLAPAMSVIRPFTNSNQFGHRSHQQPAGHQKAVQPSKEWKPKSSQKNAVTATDGLSTEPALPAAEIVTDGVKHLNIEAGNLSDTSSLRENQGVIIAEHIRVPDLDRHRVTFGSFGLDANSTNFVAELQSVRDAVEFGGDTSASIPSSDATNVTIAEQESPESSAAAEYQFSDTKPSSPQNSESYAEIGMISSETTSYALPESQKHHDAVSMGSYSAYNPQTGYNVTYFRQPDDGFDRGASAQEGLNSHAAGMIPASQALYQQQAQIAQMYPQVHVSHYMPYRQFIPPVYVPPMGMPSYSPNTAYTHPANGNGYVLMHGGSSHLNVSAMNYGVQHQYKPVPGGSPTGFGTYTTPNGYTIQSPSGMIGATGTDDSSRLKYKDGNIYVQNPQAEAQEMWMQNPRETAGIQSSPYYNMQGQSPHGTYMASHPGHQTAFSSAQSSHMQFPGLYHPQAQATPIPSHHHMAPANINVGVPQAAPMAQVGAYQQPQMNHHQWTSNTF